MAKKKPVHKKKKPPTPPVTTPVVDPPVGNGQPIFGQPQPSPDPTSFKNPVMDQSYSEITTLGVVPEPVGGAVEPILTLAQAYGSAGPGIEQTIQAAGQIVFHSVGDTGSL